MWTPCTAHENPSIPNHSCYSLSYLPFLHFSAFIGIWISNCFCRLPLIDHSMDQTSASPSATTTRKRKRTTHYQVFINHRGPDVKKTLASTIYHWLQGKGLQVFLDIDEFQPGQQLESTIEDAIRTSSVHIAIFSKGYAESVWCLKELCLMLETGAPIIPVFYDVRPNDLRWIEKGEYASAFGEHERKGRVDSETISDWKSALNKISYVSGFDLRDPNTLNGDQGQLFKHLEDTVFQKLEPVPLEVPTDAVGLDEAIGDFESFIERVQQNKNEKVKIVGVVGFGGSGKTTLAKEFFNRKCRSFERSSFLFDLRDASNKNALPGLQSRLLQDLLHEKDCEMGSVTEGKGIIKKRLQYSTPRVLIVLDDIDHKKQVEALLVKDVLGSGSLIIITSRDKEALRLSEAGSIYRRKTLSPEHARDLFCKHAFLQPYPMAGFEDLVEEFCERCGRLPLFLKVTGAHLRVNADNKREVWEDELRYTPKDVLDILDVTYNAMCKEEKHIFVDIACFFLGEDKNLAIKVWDACEGRGLLRLKNLENKCLIEFDNHNCFKMHDHLWDFGREIANRESPCRLWNESQAANFHATKEFRGIMAATPDRFILKLHGIPFCRSFYKPPLNEIDLLALKILAIKGDCFDEQIGKRSENLVWVRWLECPHTNISPWLMSMKNLTVLKLLGGDIEEWPLCEQVHLRQLRIVSTELSMISIPENVCPRLEILDLQYNDRLIEVKHLPRKLVQLNMIYCENLQKLQCLEHLPRLRNLDISGCSVLRELPKLQHLPSLKTLDVSDCTKLQHIQCLKDLPQLRDLDIHNCSELRGLPKLQHLSSLEILDLSCRTKLQHIQGLEDLPQLRDLNISRCSELRELTKLQHLPSLEILNVSCCTKLQHIQGLEDLPQLRDLNISWCSELSKLPKLQHLPSLETLKASHCTNLQHTQGLEDLPQLRDLDISDCSELLELPKLQHLPSLETLNVSDCIKLQHIQNLEDLPGLRKLSIVGCSELQEFGNLAQVISLEEIKADGCWALHSIQGLDRLQELKSLTLSAEYSEYIWSAIRHMQKLPRSMCLSARTVPNFLRTVDLPGIRLYGTGNVGGFSWMWELPAWAEEENRPTYFMICFVVQLRRTVSGPHALEVTLGGSDVDVQWEMRVEHEAWVCATFEQRSCNKGIDSNGERSRDTGSRQEVVCTYGSYKLQLQQDKLAQMDKELLIKSAQMQRDLDDSAHMQKELDKLAQIQKELQVMLAQMQNDLDNAERFAHMQNYLKMSWPIIKTT